MLRASIAMDFPGNISEQEKNFTGLSELADCGLTIPECEKIIWIKRVMFSITLAFAAVTLTVIIILRKYQSFGEKILMNMLIATFAETIVSLSSDGHPGIGCFIAGFFIQVFAIVLFMFICALTVFLVYLLYLKKVRQLKHERFYIMVCWIFPIVIALLPISTNDYGEAGVMCWIKGTMSWGNNWRMLLYYGPVSAGILVILIAYIALHSKTWREKRQLPYNAYNRYNKGLAKRLRSLSGYGFAFLLIHILMLIERLYTVFYPAHFTPKVFHMVAYSSYGSVLCSLFYILNGKKDFTLNKFKVALLHHKRFFLGKYNGKIVTYPAGTTIATISERITTCHQIGTDNAGFRNDLSTISEEQDIDGSIPFDSQIQESIGSIQADIDFNQDNAKNSSICESLELTELSGVLEDPFPISIQESLGFDQSVLRRNEAAQPMGISMDPSMDTGCVLEHTHKYEMKPESNLVKIYVDANHSRWESLADSWTMEAWTNILKADIPNDASITIVDQDGSHFGKHIVWSQIKQVCSGVRIIINSNITDVSFPKAYKLNRS